MKGNKKNSKLRRPQGKPRVDRGQPQRDSREDKISYDGSKFDKFQKDMTDKSNDPRWYANSPELMRAAASVPFSPVPGRKLDFSGYSWYQGSDSVPGILAMYWTPAIPANYGSAIDQAANSILSYTVHANSRTLKYDAPDELMLIMAGANLFSALAHGIRAYGIMRRYYQQESYTPDGLLLAMGFDPQDLRDNYSNMWFQLNELIARSQQIWIPNTMPIIERWFWMNSNIYKDGDSVKSQYYLYVPAVFYRLSETAVTTGTSLQPIEWALPLKYINLDPAPLVDPHTPRAAMTLPTDGAASKMIHKWDEYIAIVNSMFNALLNSQDRGIIFGDILKAYGADKLYSLSELNVDYTTEPVYDREVLTQIENLTTFVYNPGAIQQTANGHIFQAFDTFAGSPASRQNAACTFSGPREQVLNFHQKEVPTPEQIMVATRMKVAGVAVNGLTTGGKDLAPVTSGTEVCIGLSMVVNDWGTNNNKTTRLIYVSQYIGSWYSFNNSGTKFTYDMYGKWENGQKGNLMWLFNMYMAFDWAPWIYTVAPDDIDGTPTPGAAAIIYDRTGNAMGDWDNYTIVGHDLLHKMNVTAIYSEYGVPSQV